ncbi:hypothetical protein FE257_005219 [Aspergillus nanangensis]|uniref:SNF2 family helicase/ATPase n=1 Tax=Aspergillus nanangensis TaxID=2582783 RepID=A0AAD4CR78_ASPNN|nr:hypothetical protein FE257_005219 [Aspergillus nanangensis]
MQADLGDPLDWTVDEVITFLCHNQETPWSQSSSQAPRPDPASLETALRANIITGEVLLHDVDKEALRNDLGLKALGHRSSILTAIRYLRGNSSKYQGVKARLSSREGSQSISRESPFPLRGATLFSPASSHVAREENPLHSSLQRPALISPSMAAAPDLKETFAADPLPPHHLPGEKGKQPLSNARLCRDSSPPEPVRTPKTDHFSEAVTSSHTRPGEHVFVDDRGKKRRRLNLPKPANPQSEHRLPDANAKTWYMGPQKLCPSELFYSSAPDENDRLFMTVGSNFPSAQRSFVNKRLCYFYKQKPIKLRSDDGLKQRAIVPCRWSALGDDNQGLFTLYTSKDGKCTASKELIKDWPQLTKSMEKARATEASHDSDPYSYLIQKYPAQEEDDSVCPLYGDSGSEGDYDEETWQEIEAEKLEVHHRPRKLTNVEIDSTIDNCIREFENNWHRNCRPREEHRARKIWLAAKRANCTNNEIKALTRDIGLLNTRQQKFLDAIRECEYSSRDELKNQCQSVQQTIANIQKQKWRISILEQEICPARIPVARKPPSKRQNKRGHDDEESIGSESEVSSDSLDDFVDNSKDAVVSNPQPEASFFSDSEYDMISPSGARRKSRMGGNPFAGSSSSESSSSPSPTPWPKGLPDTIECIDLTADTSAADELRIETPPLNPVQVITSQPLEDPFKTEKSPSISPSRDLGDSLLASIPKPASQLRGRLNTRKKSTPLPDINDIDKMLSMSWHDIEERQDRRRLLAKLIGGISAEERKKLVNKIPRYDLPDIQLLTSKAIEGLLNSQQKLDELDEFENEIIMRTAVFYISWVNCVHLQVQGLPRHCAIKADRDIADGFRPFFTELRTRLETFRAKDQENVETNSDPLDTPRKTRKRAVKESQTAKREQESGQRRAEQQSKEKALFERKLGRLGLSNTDSSHQAVTFGDPVIYLHPKIGEYVKPHQLEGIRFMWREVIQNDTQQGCILAHTMGLGKTMQVISLLATISDAAASDNLLIRRQVPSQFQRMQGLILCPSSLIENWDEEFQMWTTDAKLGPLRKVASTNAFHARLHEIIDWDREGGVLIMSYDIFRTWILNKETKQRKPPLTDAQHSTVKKCLLDGPNIIVADEAHKMKNPDSALSLAAIQFRSNSRIALTGSPLANNLKDYFTMVNWVAQGYLGLYNEFDDKYIEPIEQGLYRESTYTERRKSLVKLQVLKSILEPKINRADISVLAGDMPPKVEFLITVPLTQLQTTAYNTYVEATLCGGGDVTNAKLWSWLTILRLCCSHPSCFLDKLLSRTSEPSLGEELPGDETIAQAGLPNSERMVSNQKQIFDLVPDRQALELSCRTQLVDQIIERSLRVHDKVLIFSHSLPTLDYMEHMLKRSNRSYRRLDGKTPVGTRQAATKEFNSNDTSQVYLISTRAGGLGLNIPGANRVILLDFFFNPTWEEQAVGRAYRLGQKKPVFVYRFVAGGTFEELVYNKAVFKTQLATRVVDKKNPVRLAAKSLGEYLFPAKEVPTHDVTEYIGKDPRVLDEIIKSDVGEEKLIRKIVLTETFQKDDNEKLTEEERQGVEQELSDELLKRTNPEAWERLMEDRRREVLAPAQIDPVNPHSVSQGHGFDTQPRPSIAYNVPSHEHNTGPPALAPDMSIIQPPAQPATTFVPNHPAEFPKPPVDQVTPTATNIARPRSESSSGAQDVSPGRYDGPAVENIQEEDNAKSDGDSVDLLAKNPVPNCTQQ